jgi:hypothetical protein
MAARDRRFMGRAWDSLALTRNIFGKFLLLCLLQIIPVVGQMIALGYFLGWLREAAWDMNTPIGAHVCGSGDPDFWGHGAKAWVINLLYCIIIAFEVTVFTALVGFIAGGNAFFANGDAASVSPIENDVLRTVLIVLVVVVCIVVTIILAVLDYMGLIRLAIYNKFGAAWQWGIQMKMAGRDFGGLVKIFFGMLGLSIVLSICSCIVATPAIISSLLPILSSVMSTMNGFGGDNTAALVLQLFSILGAWSLVYFLISLLLEIPVFILYAIGWRALGNWAAQLDVARWGSMYDPLPDREESAAPAPALRPGYASGAGAGQYGATANDASAGSGYGSQELAVAAPEPEKRGHPVLCIVLCYVFVLLIGIIMGVAGVVGITNDVQGSNGSNALFGELETPEGTWTLGENAAISLADDGTFEVYGVTDSHTSLQYSGTYTSEKRTPTSAEKNELNDLIEEILSSDSDGSGIDANSPIYQYLDEHMVAFDVSLNYTSAEASSSSSSAATASLPSDETITIVSVNFLGFNAGVGIDEAGNTTVVVRIGGSSLSPSAIDEYLVSNQGPSSSYMDPTRV